MNELQDQPPFIVRHPWVFVVFAFSLFLGAWSLLIVVATKAAPQRIEWKVANP